MSTIERKPLLHGRDHCPGGADPIPCLGADAAFSDAIYELADTRDLLGYWRLGEGASPYADTNPTYTPCDAVEIPGGVAMTDDYTPGALTEADDDGAVAFNGGGTTVGDFLYAADVPAYRFNLSLIGDEMTVLAWIKPFASASSFSGGIAGVYKEGVSTPAGWGLHYEWPAGLVTYSRRVLNGTHYKIEAPAAFDEWSFVAGTYSQTNGMRLYVNGILVDSDPSAAALSFTPNTGVEIGHLDAYVSTADAYFSGGIDEVSVWGDELTAAEIVDLTSSGGTPGGGGWSGHYPIVDADVASGADIDPLKLEHPGGTTSFLRADGTWAAPASNPNFLAREQGPMPGSPGSLGMYRVPYFDGAGVTFTLARASLHLETPGSTDSVLVIEKSSTADVFTPVEITTLTVASAAYSATDDTSGLGTLDSGDLLRFRWSSLGTDAESYHAQLEGAI